MRPRMTRKTGGAEGSAASRRTSGYRGVSFHQPSGKWRARIKASPPRAPGRSRAAPPATQSLLLAAAGGQPRGAAGLLRDGGGGGGCLRPGCHRVSRRAPLPLLP